MEGGGAGEEKGKDELRQRGKKEAAEEGKENS